MPKCRYPSGLFSASVRALSLIPLLLLVGACSGGGGGGDGEAAAPAPQSDLDARYGGTRAAAALTGANAKALLLAAIEGIDLLEQLSMMATGNLSRRYYFSIGDSDYEESFSDPALATCDSGRIDTVDGRNAEGLGELRFEYHQCATGGYTRSGVIRFTITRVSDAQIAVHSAMENLQLFGVGEPAPTILNARLEQSLVAPGFNLGDPVWTGELLLDSGQANEQVLLRNVRRSGRSDEDYRVQGAVLHSGYGEVQLGVDSAQSTVTLRGESSSLAAGFTAGGYAPLLLGQLVEDYSLALDSDGDGTVEQQVTLPVELLTAYGEQASTFSSLQLVGTGAEEKHVTVLVDLAFLDNPNQDLYGVRWSVGNTSTACPVRLQAVSDFQATLDADCHGIVDVHATVDDGRAVHTYVHRVQFQRFLPQVAFTNPPATTQVGQGFSAATTELNPEEGPYSYAVAYAPAGTTVSDNGVLNWDGSAWFPMLGPDLQVNYAVAASNERPGLAAFSTTLTFSPYEAPTAYPVASPIFLNLHHGAVDLEPANPAGDIVFVRRNHSAGGTVVSKYNKATELVREVVPAEFIPAFRDHAHGMDKNARPLAFLDYNQDGKRDLVFTRGGDNFDRRIYVYDLYNETELLDESLYDAGFLNVSTNTRISDLDYLDIDGDGQREFVFLVWGSGLYLQDGSTSPAGVYKYTPGTFQVELLLNLKDKLFGGHALLIGDYNNDDKTDLLVVGDYLHFAQYDGTAFVETAYHRINFEAQAAFIDFMVEDVEGDGIDDIVLFYERDLAFTCIDGEGAGYIRVLGDDFMPKYSHTVNSHIWSVADFRAGGNDGNFFQGGINCSTGKWRFAYVNARWGKEIWTRDYLGDEPFVAHARQSIASYIDAEGKPRLVIGAHDGIYSVR